MVLFAQWARSDHHRAECAAGGSPIFEDSYDPGCPSAGLFMNEFITGVCFNPDDGSCIDNSGISKRAGCQDGEPASQPTAKLQDSQSGLIQCRTPAASTLLSFLPGRQWLEPKSKLVPCDSCVGVGTRRQQLETGFSSRNFRRTGSQDPRLRTGIPNGLLQRVPSQPSSCEA